MPGWYDILGYSPSPEELLNIKVASPADDAAAAAAYRNDPRLRGGGPGPALPADYFSAANVMRRQMMPQFEQQQEAKVPQLVGMMTAAPDAAPVARPPVSPAEAAYQAGFQADVDRRVNQPIANDMLLRQARQAAADRNIQAMATPLVGPGYGANPASMSTPQQAMDRFNMRGSSVTPVHGGRVVAGSAGPGSPMLRVMLPDASEPAVPQFQGPRIAMYGSQKYNLSTPEGLAAWEAAKAGGRLGPNLKATANQYTEIQSDPNLVGQNRQFGDAWAEQEKLAAERESMKAKLVGGKLSPRGEQRLINRGLLSADDVQQAYNNRQSTTSYSNVAALTGSPMFQSAPPMLKARLYQDALQADMASAVQDKRTQGELAIKDKEIEGHKAVAQIGIEAENQRQQLNQTFQGKQNELNRNVQREELGVKRDEIALARDAMLDRDRAKLDEYDRQYGLPIGTSSRRAGLPQRGSYSPSIAAPASPAAPQGVSAPMPNAPASQATADVSIPSWKEAMLGLPAPNTASPATNGRIVLDKIRQAYPNYNTDPAQRREAQALLSQMGLTRSNMMSQQGIGEGPYLNWDEEGWSYLNPASHLRAWAGAFSHLFGGDGNESEQQYNDRKPYLDMVNLLMPGR